MAILEVDGLGVAYGDIQVLWDVSMHVDSDERIIAIVGSNGAGKSTLLRTLSGLIEPTAGEIRLFGEDASKYSPAEIVERGFVHVTEERNLFDRITVRENLRMGAYTNREEFDELVAEVYEMFPVLEERASQKAGTLSGGEQQMLVIARGLMARPRLLALDEPSGALAPQLIERVFEKIEEISEEIPVILVEQHVDRVLELADRAYLLENGRVATEGGGDELLESDELIDAYLRG